MRCSSDPCARIRFGGRVLNRKLQCKLRARSVLRGRSDQFDTTVPAANEQPESAQPNADDRSAAVTNKASRPAANSQRFIDENSKVFAITMNREPVILLGVLVKA